MIVVERSDGTIQKSGGEVLKRCGVWNNEDVMNG